MMTHVLQLARYDGGLERGERGAGWQTYLICSLRGCTPPANHVDHSHTSGDDVSHMH